MIKVGLRSVQYSIGTYGLKLEAFAYSKMSVTETFKVFGNEETSAGKCIYDALTKSEGFVIRVEEVSGKGNVRSLLEAIGSKLDRKELVYWIKPEQSSWAFLSTDGEQVRVSIMFDSSSSEGHRFIDRFITLCDISNRSGLNSEMLFWLVPSQFREGDARIPIPTLEEFTDSGQILLCENFGFSSIILSRDG